MSSSSSRQRKREILARQEQARQAARMRRLNPELPPDELAAFRSTTARLVACAESMARPAALLRRARIPEETRSHLGGAFLDPNGASWPTSATGEPLTGVLEIFVAELAPILIPSEDADVVQLFLPLEQTSGWPVISGEPVVRCLSGTAHPTAQRGVALDVEHVGWSIETDVPPLFAGEDETYPPDVLEPFLELDDAEDLFEDLFPELSYTTRIGGWRSAGESGYLGLFVGHDLKIDLGADGEIEVWRGDGPDDWDCMWNPH